MLSLFLATVNFQVPKIDFLQIVPVMLLGFLVTAALFLEIKDDDEEPKGPVSRPTILGLGAVGLLTLIGYYLSWDHTAFFIMQSAYYCSLFAFKLETRHS